MYRTCAGTYIDISSILTCMDKYVHICIGNVVTIHMCMWNITYVYIAEVSHVSN